jgi:sulfite reductase (NADPH) flavoprotein alpha-component
MSLSIIPDSAPFNSEQRAWLNGFLAGWLGLQDAAGTAVNGAASLPAIGASPIPDAAIDGAPGAAHEDANQPWHDPAIPIDERLKLAEGKPREFRLMAAMAQLDCGTCGYLCRTYSEAIANGTETSLTLCSPGGSETSKAIKKLLKEPSTNGNGNGNGPAAVARPAARPDAAGWSRRNPYDARLIRSVNLSKPGSDKAVHHVEIDLGTDGPTYEVGDSLGLFPTNCGDLIGEIAEALGARGDEPVEAPDGAATTLRDALERHACLSEVTEDLLARLASAATDSRQADELRALVEDDVPIAGLHVLDLLRRFPSARLSPSDLARSLAGLKPRLYSISSSPKRHAGQVHLTVGRVAYTQNDRGRKGVASTMLADRVEVGGILRVFVQKSHGFTIPADSDAPAIMIGPGTGIAPFRAFLHERNAIGARGRNWLFFGDQRGAFDFLYEDELKAMRAEGVLSRLDTAFSRDQDRKVYVQDRMVEHGRDLFGWLAEGAHVFVCGDAKRMAADVDRALRAVVRTHGAMAEDQATAYVARLASEGRYRRDVY